MANQNVRRSNAGLSQEQVQVVHDLLNAVIDGPAIAPRVACPIVRADASEGRNGCLYQSPLHGKAASAIFYDYGRRTGACAVQVQSPATQVDELSRRHWFLTWRHRDP
jgi:hypothetical protein